MNELFQHISPATYLAVIGGVLTCIFALLGSVARQDKPRRSIHWCAFAAGIIVLVAGILSEIESSRQTLELESRSKKIVDLSEQNVSLSEQLLAFSTSGESFCYIQPMPDDLSQRQTLMLFHEGDYPLYDVELNISDSTGVANLPMRQLYDEIIASHKKDDAMGRDRQRDLMTEIQSLQAEAEKFFRIGTVPPRTARNLFRIQWPKGDTQDIHIQIHTRNSYFSQVIKEKKIDGKWKYSYRVFRHGPKGETILAKEWLSAGVDLPDK